jgi:putative ABC transport system permease protein
LQLVLNAIFHLEASPANIAWSDYQEIQKHPGVTLAVPLAMGDNYRGFRVVGTLPEMLTVHEYAPGRRYVVQPPGRMFDLTLREAVVGSFAARKLGLTYGSHFHPYHGLSFNSESEHKEHEEEYVVVGILEPSNTPADKVIWIPLEGVQKMSGHVETASTEVSAVLVKLRGPTFGPALDQAYNKKGTRLTWAWPIGATMAELFKKIGWFDDVLGLVARLVAVVAAASVTASIYNSMNERRRQIAIMRALGAGDGRGMDRDGGDDDRGVGMSARFHRLRRNLARRRHGVALPDRRGFGAVDVPSEHGAGTARVIRIECVGWLGACHQSLSD